MLGPKMSSPDVDPCMEQSCWEWHFQLLQGSTFGGLILVGARGAPQTEGWGPCTGPPTPWVGSYPKGQGQCCWHAPNLIWGNFFFPCFLSRFAYIPGHLFRNRNVSRDIEAFTESLFRPKFVICRFAVAVIFLKRRRFVYQRMSYNWLCNRCVRIEKCVVVHDGAITWSKKNDFHQLLHALSSTQNPTFDKIQGLRAYSFRFFYQI